MKVSSLSLMGAKRTEIDELEINFILSVPFLLSRCIPIFSI
jgi:hypothetical protein